MFSKFFNQSTYIRHGTGIDHRGGRIGNIKYIACRTVSGDNSAYSTGICLLSGGSNAETVAQYCRHSHRTASKWRRRYAVYELYSVQLGAYR